MAVLEVSMRDAAIMAECRRLRIQERLSGVEINRRTGVSNGTLSGWLKDVPLTAEEIRKKVIGSHLGKPGKKKYRGEESKYNRMVTGYVLTRQDKAKVAEAAILFRLCLKRFIVYGSPFDGDKADWLIESADAPGKTYRIQVKWTKDAGKHGGLPLIPLWCMEKGKLRRYKEGEFDFIVGYCLFNDTAYVYSFAELKHLKALVSISDDAAEAWQKIVPE